MFEFFNHPSWGKISDFLMSGRPPIIVQLLALNALFFAILAVRRASGAQQMEAGATLLVQMGVLAANLLVLFQQQALDFVRPYLWF